MRKRVIEPSVSAAAEPVWLDLNRLASVEYSSEAAAYPVEAALVPGTGPGWRAAGPGEQRIRLVFDQRVNLGRVGLWFSEDARERTQEFVLSWSPESGQPGREILRQQYHFSPLAATREVEDYRVELEGVKLLELRIVPDISGGDACASLDRLRLA